MNEPDQEHHIAPGLTVRRRHLKNGLCLITLVDKSAPIVSYQSWFGVGSRHERPGATGMAHFFEHLMFAQTRTHAPGEFDRLIEETGGDSNAATWVDWTFYRTSVPSQHLALVVRLEADRMQNLVLEPSIVEPEREVVINERLQRVDDSIDGFASEELFRLAFERHPYRWPTIGWMEDIRALDIDSIRHFYQQYYAPNNATIVVVGDFDDEELLALITREYAAIPASSLPATDENSEPVQQNERRARFSKPTTVGRLLFGYKAPGQRDADWAVAQMACALLTAGNSSRLHRRLVIEDELAIAVEADVMPFRDPGLLELSCFATPEADLDALETAIDEELLRLGDKEIEMSELEKIRNIVETDFWGQLSTVDGKAEALGHFQCTVGDFGELFRTEEALSKVDAAQLRAYFKNHLQPAQRSIVRIDPVTS